MHGVYRIFFLLGLGFASIEIEFAAEPSTGVLATESLSPPSDNSIVPRQSAIPESTVTLKKIEVTASRESQMNSIDRKVYRVGREIQSAAGTASDLLLNIPSVQVDIDGNVSLRGSENVLILIDGKPSTLMSAKNRGDALAQLPAGSIDQIEVITNPSAQYKPDGEAGIINITTKHEHDPGYSGILRANLGNEVRANAGLSANYSEGSFNVFASIYVRKDDRLRTVEDVRSHNDLTNNHLIETEQQTTEHMRPLSRIFQGGVDYSINENNKFGLTAGYNNRTFFRSSTVTSQSRIPNGILLSDFDRLRADREWQETTTLGATYRHSFSAAGQELNVEIKRDRHAEQEDNHYTNVFRTPSAPLIFDDTLIRPIETVTQLTADFVHPLVNGAKFESGFDGQTNKDDADFRGDMFDGASGASILFPSRTNRFVYREKINALYATYRRAIGSFGFLAGLRGEQTNTDASQLTTGVRNKNAYFRIYPSLHLTYNLSEADQLQLNYSHRVHRPESDDLNPFPEYQDPYNLRVGNPRLKPEETHSIEVGYQYHQDSTTFLSTLYYRDTWNAFTTVTRYIDNTTLLTTQENLTSNKSGGLELAASKTVGKDLTINVSSNTFYSEIDARNLGYSDRRSSIAWEAKLNADWRISRADLIQLNTNYRAKRLTAQGYRLPTFIASIGMRHDFKGRKTALVLTIADLFNSLKERTIIDTPALHENFVRRRNSRTYYIGFIYDFGAKSKKPKDDSLKIDDSL